MCAIRGAGPAPLATIECATADADGKLGAFAALPAELTVARDGAAAAVIGPWLYMIGGRSAAASCGAAQSPAPPSARSAMPAACS